MCPDWNWLRSVSILQTFRSEKILSSVLEFVEIEARLRYVRNISLQP
jgi:hypothetical protein